LACNRNNTGPEPPLQSIQSISSQRGYVTDPRWTILKVAVPYRVFQTAT